MFVKKEVKNIIVNKKRELAYSYNDIAKLMNKKCPANIINGINAKVSISYKFLFKICKVLNLDYKEILEIQINEV